MKTFTVNIDDNTFNYNLLKLKAGQTITTPAGDIVTEGILGIKDFSLMVNDYQLTASILLGGWKTSERYEKHLKREQFSESYFSFMLQFDKHNIPPFFLNKIVFDDNYLFGVEFTQPFMVSLLALPDGGGTFADRWEIILES